MEHEALSSKDKEFWDFAFEEIGTLDVPATIDYIAKLTGQSKVAYIAHSEGTTQMFYALSTEMEDYFAEKMSLFIALAPSTNGSRNSSEFMQFVA